MTSYRVLVELPPDAFAVLLGAFGLYWICLALQWLALFASSS